MFRKTLIAATALATTFGAGNALAQSGPVMIGGGDDMRIVYPAGTAPGGGIVGGAEVRMSGGGDDRSATYANAYAATPGQVATILGGGDNAVIVYLPFPASSALALAEAAPGTARR